jgi:putative addiction module component (TIGR02574 family)
MLSELNRSLPRGGNGGQVMTEIAERIKREMSSLSTAERAELAHFLLQTLDDGADEDAEVAWDAELTRRAEEIHGGTAVGEPAEEVMARLRRKYS